MTDEEVGNLWRLYRDSMLGEEVICPLIRKLVETQEEVYHLDLSACYPLSPSEAALEKFDIDPETWE